LEPVIEACEHTMIPVCADAKVTFAVEVAPDLPRVMGDAVRLRQILLNLLSNASKFTPEGGRIVLKSYTDGETGDVLVSVSDTGIGMRPEDIPVALEPFGQIDSSLARRYEGTGLGLPLTKLLVEKHGGTLEIVSSPGNGTTVTVRLPPADEASDAPVFTTRHTANAA
jgi:signal transduction histidine kinase